MEKFDFKNFKRYGIILIISGPSGVGKSTICKQVLDEDPNISFSISCTTRAPRPGEKDGKDYYFISIENFKNLINENAFIEYAKVHGNYYGTLKSEVLRKINKGEDTLLDIDVQGAMNIKEFSGKDEVLKKCCEFIFITPPTFNELEERLKGRGTEDYDVVKNRLKDASAELSQWSQYEYLIINKDISLSVKYLKSIVETLRCKVKRMVD